MWRARCSARSTSCIPDQARGWSGINAPMRKARRFQLDELTLRPGTYFNPQTEILIVVDDSPEVSHEVFDADELDADDWVLISEDSPLDEHRRDELVERFELSQ